MDFAERIANNAIDVGGLTISSEKPVLWASGRHMPIYNDNRKLLSKHSFRMDVVDAFADIIEKNHLSFDYIAGTSTSGIAPAASLADRFNAPLVILKDGVPFGFYDLHIFDEDLLLEIGGIASTVPWAIPFGVVQANNGKLPFLYVRKKSKDHGLGNSIEGVPVSGMELMLAAYHRGDDYSLAAANELLRQGMYVEKTVLADISEIVHPISLTGKRILHVEDLVSTGGSRGKEATVYDELGATITDTLAIFSYGLDVALKNFSPENTLRPILTYDQLIPIAVSRGMIKAEEREILLDWKKDPMNWGYEHGFDAEPYAVQEK